MGQMMEPHQRTWIVILLGGAVMKGLGFRDWEITGNNQDL